MENRLPSAIQTTRIYVVIIHDWEDSYCEGVFDSGESAKAFVLSRKKSDMVNAEIQAWNVNGKNLGRYFYPFDEEMA